MRTQQERTFRALNMHLVDFQDCDPNGWPYVEPCYEVPDRLISFCIGAKEKDGYAHFFLDDYRFERLWNKPESYINALSAYEGVIGPDFSIYTDMPRPMQMWNKYRAMALTNYWQRMGLSVVPNLVWSDEDSLWYMFDGMPVGGTFCVGTVGMPKADGRAKANFQTGIDAALANLRPDTLLVYGSYRDFDTHDMCNVVYYENDNRARLKAWEESDGG